MTLLEHIKYELMGLIPVSGLNLYGTIGAGTGEKFAGSVSNTPSDLSHVTESKIVIGGGAAYGFIGGSISTEGTYVSSTASLKDQSVSVAWTPGVGYDAYVRKETSIPIIGAAPPEGLTLSSDSSFSTPNYKGTLFKPNTTTIGPVNRTTSIGPVSTAPVPTVPVNPLITQQAKLTR
jgi:hypothetical protein